MRHVFLFAALFLPVALLADDAVPPPVTKDDARRILEAMDWLDVKIIAVVQGVNEKKTVAPSLALVLALARRDAKYQDLKLDLYYDRDLGWFTFESNPQLFRIWNRDGYHEIKARTP